MHQQQTSEFQSGDYLKIKMWKKFLICPSTLTELNGNGTVDLTLGVR